MVAQPKTTLPIIGKLPPDWKVTEFGSVLVGGTRNGIYKPKQFHGTGDKIVNMGELFANPRLYSVPMSRVQLTEDERRRFNLRVGDLLFARRSLTAEGAGKCSIVCEIIEPTTFESSIIRARPNPSVADGNFLYYLFLSPYGSYVLETIRRQVAVAGITGTDLVQLEIPLPPLTEQNTIAHILSTLDDKIALNCQMNQTLEGMTRASFKSWFVDFDPVRAREEGRAPEGIDAETAVLFPDSFQDSELGEIPSGWKVSTLGDIAINPRRGVSPAEVEPRMPYFGLEHLPRRSITLDEWGTAQDVSSNKFRFHKGEILFGKLRPYFHKVGFAIVDGVCSTDILVVAPKESIWHGFVLSHLSSDKLIQHVTAATTGTRMPRTNWNDLAGYKIAVPTEAIAKAFNRVISSFLQKIENNIWQSRTLAETRDALLPKLMSGEIRVKP